MLDPYEALRRRPAIGPINAVATRPRAATVAGGFAYLAGDSPNLPLVLHGLSCSSIDMDVYVRDTQPGWHARNRRPGIALLEERQNLVERLPGTAVLLHHGGIATTHEALWAGVPQLLLTKTLEQALTGRAIAEAGIGFTAPARGARVADWIVQAVWRATRDPKIAEAAAARGAQLRQDFPTGSHHVILAHVADVLGRG
jgi:hypothetical protein